MLNDATCSTKTTKALKQDKLRTKAFKCLPFKAHSDSI